MGYSTDFKGSFTCHPPLSSDHQRYLTAFSITRRVKRNELRAEQRTDLLRVMVGLPIGVEGGYYVSSSDNYGGRTDDSVTCYNTPPEGQPSLWCGWIPNEDGTEIIWDGAEKFYEYVPWLNYLIEHFLKPWGYFLSGEVEWAGEDNSDNGTITMVNGTPVIDMYTREEENDDY